MRGWPKASRVWLLKIHPDQVPNSFFSYTDSSKEWGGREIDTKERHVIARSEGGSNHVNTRKQREQSVRNDVQTGKERESQIIECAHLDSVNREMRFAEENLNSKPTEKGTKRTLRLHSSYKGTQP